MRLFLAGLALFVVAEVLAFTLPSGVNIGASFIVGLPSGALMFIGFMDWRDKRRHRHAHMEATR